MTRKQGGEKKGEYSGLLRASGLAEKPFDSTAPVKCPTSVKGSETPSLYLKLRPRRRTPSHHNSDKEPQLEKTKKHMSKGRREQNGHATMATARKQ